MKLDEARLQEVVEKIAYQQFGEEQIDDLYAKMGILNDYVQEQLRLFAVSGSVLKEIRQAFADYCRSEGCSCCRNKEEHDKAEEKLAEILKPDKYEDGSGYDWYKYASTER